MGSSDILYADEKRTIPLLRSVGLQIRPTELQRSGSMGSISYSQHSVNIEGVPFSDIIGKMQERSLPTINGSSAGSGALSGEISSSISIHDTEEKSNRKISTEDISRMSLAGALRPDGLPEGYSSIEDFMHQSTERAEGGPHHRYNVDKKEGPTDATHNAGDTGPVLNAQNAPPSGSSDPSIRQTAPGVKAQFAQSAKEYTRKVGGGLRAAPCGTTGYVARRSGGWV